MKAQFDIILLIVIINEKEKLVEDIFYQIYQCRLIVHDTSDELDDQGVERLDAGPENG